MVRVVDASGQSLSLCTDARAKDLVAHGAARWLAADPPTIQLSYAVPPIPQRQSCPTALPGEGKRLLLHICCAPCGTYTIERAREQGFEVNGLWYNPNIHPFSEHRLRLEHTQRYAEAVELPLIVWPDYEMVEFLRAVAERESYGQRCVICYELRLRCAAVVASERGFDAFTTTLLISPYQQQRTIQEIGDRLGQEYGVPFYFENFRRGWARRGQIARAHDLYQQRYCGCLYSEWEASDRHAWTRAGQREMEPDVSEHGSDPESPS